MILRPIIMKNVRGIQPEIHLSMSPSRGAPSWLRLVWLGSSMQKCIDKYVCESLTEHKWAVARWRLTLIKWQPVIRSSSELDLFSSDRNAVHISAPSWLSAIRSGIAFKCIPSLPRIETIHKIAKLDFPLFFTITFWRNWFVCCDMLSTVSVNYSDIFKNILSK